MPSCTVLPNFVKLVGNPTPRILGVTTDNGDNFLFGNYFIELIPLVQGTAPPNPIYSSTVTVSSSQNEILFPTINFTVNNVGPYIIKLNYNGDTQFYTINQNRNYYEIYQTDGQFYLLKNLVDINPPSSTTFTIGVYILGINSYFLLETYQLALSNGTNTYISDNVTVTNTNTYILNFTFNVPEGFVAGIDYLGTVTEGTIIQNTFNSLEIQLSCYIEGTKIQLEDGRYIPIEDLREGDFLNVYKIGSLPILKIVKNKMYHSKNNKNLNKLFIYSKQDYPELFDDLIVTGGHSILVDNLSNQEYFETSKYYWREPKKVIDKFLLLSVINNKAKILEEEGEFIVYQIVLDSPEENQQYGIYANGILSETMSIEYYYSNYCKKLKIIVNS